MQMFTEINRSLLDVFIQKNRLPVAFAESAQRCYLPFADWLEVQVAANNGETYVLGINGAQGSGKSTLAKLLAEYLTTSYARNVVILSIDDIYLTRAERRALAAKVHPLLRTRGVPGTHDVALGISVIQQLCALQKGESALIPAFDKSRDDRYPESDWPSVHGPVDLVIFEGWCVGSRPVAHAKLAQAVNELEASADANRVWRTYVNMRLASDYVKLFATLDALLFLQVPNFEAVFRWRLEQEHKLRHSAPQDADAVMSDAQVSEFIQHFERITRNNLAELPSIADAVIKLGDDHQALSLRLPIQS
jgi:D-glycerate 3-kinase